MTKKFSRYNVIYSKENYKKTKRKWFWLLMSLKYIGCLRIYVDGTGWGGKFRAWHPINWIIFLIATLFAGVVNANEIRKEMFVYNEYNKVQVIKSNYNDAPEKWDGKVQWVEISG